MKGIDVSYHQGVIDWKKVKESGIEFAILRAGYGRTNIDTQFVNNANSCIANNIPFGVYWFIYGVTKDEVIQNADLCHKAIAPYKDKIKLKVWCDFEYDTDKNAQKRGVNFTKEMRTDLVVAFCERMKSYGYEVGNYANRDYMRTKFNDLSQYPLWYARYEVTKEKMLSEYKPLIWQYSSKGKVDGIKGNVDMNEYYGTFDDGKKEETEENSEENEKDNVPVKIDENAVIPYSKAKQGDEKLSANFKVKEFACNDGSDVVFVSPALVDVLQKIRNHFGKSVIINSGYRTVTYNKKVGGATYSQHLYGTAADIRISGVSPKQIAQYAETLLPNTGGIGIYKNFVHVDVRKNRSRWNG